MLSVELIKARLRIIDIAVLGFSPVSLQLGWGGLLVRTGSEWPEQENGGRILEDSAECLRGLNPCKL